MFNELIEKIAVKSPVAVMARGLLENLLSHERINAIFQQHRRIQRESPWLFSWVVSLMSVVVCQIRPSVHAAFRKMKNSAPAGLSALYDKIDGIEPQVAEALVRETATHIKQILKHVPHHRSEIIPGYHSKIVDGNKIEATDRRLKVLREQNCLALRWLSMNPFAGSSLMRFCAKTDMLRNVRCFIGSLRSSKPMICGLLTAIFVAFTCFRASVSVVVFL